MEAQKGKLKKKRAVKHNWHRLSELLQCETANYYVCKRCGMVQNEQNIDRVCPGKARLRVPEKPMKETNEREGS
jgi:rubrerythrin